MESGRQLRLLLVVPNFPKLSESFIVSKFLGLLDRGVDVRVVCGRSDPDEWAKFTSLQGRQDVRRRVQTDWPTRPRWFAVLLVPLALVRCLGAQPGVTIRYLRRGWGRFGPDVLRRLYLDAGFVLVDPDIIHFEFGTLAADRMYLKELLDCCVTVSFRGYDLNFAGLDQPAYYEQVWQQADGIHCLGNDLWSRAKRRGCPSDKPHVEIPPAIDPERFQPASTQGREEEISTERPLRLLSVGRLEWKKGYEYALRAVKLLVDGGLAVQYRIVGDGNYLEAVAFCRHQFGLEEVVHLVGALPAEGVRRELEWADVFLHAAVSEGFCNAVVEAQSMQVPVVCTDADGLAENVENGITGLVVPRRDPEALAEAVALLAKDARQRREIGAAGRRRVLEKFKVEDQIAAFEGFYQRVLDSHAH